MEFLTTLLNVRLELKNWPMKEGKMISLMIQTSDFKRCRLMIACTKRFIPTHDKREAREHV